VPRRPPKLVCRSSAAASSVVFGGLGLGLGIANGVLNTVQLGLGGFPISGPLCGIRTCTCCLPRSKQMSITGRKSGRCALVLSCSAETERLCVEPEYGGQHGSYSSPLEKEDK